MNGTINDMMCPECGEKETGGELCDVCCKWVAWEEFFSGTVAAVARLTVRPPTASVRPSSSASRITVPVM